MAPSWTILAPALLCLAACRASPETGAPSGDTFDAPSTESAHGEQDENRAWRLDETITVELPTGRSFLAEVTRTRDEMARGLMFRPSLGDDEAMIFPLEERRVVHVTMRNVRFPIDVVFLRRTRSPGRLLVTSTRQAIPPCPEAPCPLYPSRQPVDLFLELPPYTVGQEGIRTGDQIVLGRAL